MSNFDRVKAYEESINEGTTIVIIWSTEDIKDRAEERDININEEQALDALAMVENNHDCNYGITWDHLDCAIDDVIREKN